MTVLLSADAILSRRPVALGALAPLARSLRDELSPLLDVGIPWLPPEKARMTRVGGRCPAHGALLEFDPWQPHAHRCPVCGTIYRELEHYRWWIMNYQLWLAERAVHAAALATLADDAACESLAREILRAYARQYASYPNRDNVLGPTRLFFSTYLESIWLLQLTVALDLLEVKGGQTELGEEVRQRLIRPSATLIASYDEGLSNRQVYNNAALAAAGALLGDETLVAGAISGPSGLATHCTQALLADGTWYEGENYHLFAHRGLWYGISIAESMCHTLPAEAVRRYREAFATPFATALPDFTFPSRRDSQYRVSLRQWRIAESCELGVARGEDPRLLAALGVLYADDGKDGDSGRATSTAEAERNVPAVRLTRASLGWKALLFARSSLPPLAGAPATTVHLAGQGIAVFRRNDARTYVALDYGESGGGHGHPDRLNLWLVVDRSRVLEDVGTGSYVDPTLHWYRSTLAHNAPIADGRSQWRTDGELTAFDERGTVGLVSAQAWIAPDVLVERSVVVTPNYLVDEVRWSADRIITFDLPFHVDLQVAGHGRWQRATLAGGRGLEDGFDFVAEAEHLPGRPGVTFQADIDGVPIRSWAESDTPHEWWRCLAPGPPGSGRRHFLLYRTRARGGTLRTVWSWTGEVTSVAFDGDVTRVQRRSDAQDKVAREGRTWRVASTVSDVESTVVLGIAAKRAIAHSLEDAESSAVDEAGNAADDETSNAASPMSQDHSLATFVIPVRSVVPAALGTVAPLTAQPANLTNADGQASWPVFQLGRANYRRSEESWDEAGLPRAVVGVTATHADIVVEVAMPNASPVFARRCETNPLDNEHPDINSDGVQLYVGSTHGGGRFYSWILVPEHGGASVRATPRAAFGPPLVLALAARLTSEGWYLRVAIPRNVLTPGDADDFTLDLIVNEISADRERRRGQLVLSGGHDEWIYLRGDRQDPARALSFHISDD